MLLSEYKLLLKRYNLTRIIGNKKELLWSVSSSENILLFTIGKSYIIKIYNSLDFKLFLISYYFSKILNWSTK